MTDQEQQDWRKFIPDGEPDVYEQECVYIMRHPEMGHLNGYVGVPAGHPAWGMEYDELNRRDFEVHGGLTYSGDSKPLQEPDGLWWFGFDTAHAFDLCPWLAANHRMHGVYRDFEYVMNECRNLMRQLVQMRRANEVTYQCRGCGTLVTLTEPCDRVYCEDCDEEA